MTILHWGDLTWPKIAALAKEEVWPILPIGATEAHGPHLPLNTDVWIAQGMAERGARALATRGKKAVVLPPLAYTVAPFASGFAGTMTLPADALVATIEGIGDSLRAHDIARVILANAHLDPSHIRALRQACESLRGKGIDARFPDVTRKPYALWLGQEFRSGACHAGEYESSIVLALAPDLVDQQTMRALADNPSSLSQAIGAGISTFEGAGGHDAYFGSPARASAQRGNAFLDRLAAVLVHAVTGESSDEFLLEPGGH
jgi:creatinine amidohydrolase